MESTIMDAKAAAQYLGVSVPAIRRWQYEGKLKFFRAGRLIRFRRQELDAWIEKHSEGGQEG